jgi:GNAT superfamily N-acetyltransferase
VNQLTVRQLELDDWVSIKELQVRVLDSRASRYIWVDDASLEAYFYNSHFFPDRVGMLGLWEGSQLIGTVALFITATPQMNIRGAPPILHAFIHSVFIAETRNKNAGPYLLAAMEEWAAQRGAPQLLGNIYPREGRVNSFVKKYGFKPYHTVIGKDVRTNG